MAIKILIERHVRSGCESIVEQLLKDLRAEAVRTRGYVYGETLRQVDNPRVFVVISVWGAREFWERWNDTDYHRKMDERIGQFLRRPPTIRVFEDAS